VAAAVAWWWGGRGRQIGAVVPGHARHALGGAEPREPLVRGGKLGGKREIDEVAGHRDVVDVGRREVVLDEREHLGTMDGVAPAIPVDETEAALVGKLERARRRNGPEVRIGEVGENKRHYELPMSMPAMN